MRKIHGQINLKVEHCRIMIIINTTRTKNTNILSPNDDVNIRRNKPVFVRNIRIYQKRQ